MRFIVGLSVLLVLFISGCCSCMPVQDTQGDGGEQTEITLPPITPPIPPPQQNICTNKPRVTDVDMTFTKVSAGNRYSYTCTYEIIACREDVTYNIYLERSSDGHRHYLSLKGGQPGYVAINDTTGRDTVTLNPSLVEYDRCVLDFSTSDMSGYYCWDYGVCAGEAPDPDDQPGQPVIGASCQADADCPNTPAQTCYNSKCYESCSGSCSSSTFFCLPCYLDNGTTKDICVDELLPSCEFCDIPGNCITLKNAQGDAVVTEGQAVYAEIDMGSDSCVDEVEVEFTRSCRIPANSTHPETNNDERDTQIIILIDGKGDTTFGTRISNDREECTAYSASILLYNGQETCSAEIEAVRP
ncbi:hypothetical protein H6504_02875 [Candidatus Woesearchaeota archaeon]|nr:hypothetical protein [Candidatus Woesearchaeota archaeon]